MEIGAATVRTVWRILKKLKVELPYDIAILLGIYLEKTLIWKDTCTSMLIAALFTATKTQKQPKYPLTDNIHALRWYVCIYIHTRVCMSAKSLQVCQTRCDSMHCSPSGSSVHVILQARTLRGRWVATPSSKGSSWPRDGTYVSYVFCISGLFITNTIWEAPPTTHTQWKTSQP